MQEVTIQIFKFNELSETAKGKAREWYRNGQEFHFADEYMNSIKRGCEAFGYTLKDWNIDFAGCSYSSWKVSGGGDESELTGNRLRTYLVNNFEDVFTQPKKYGKRFSKIFREETCCPFTGVCGDEDFLQVFRAFIKKPNGNTLEELIDEAIQDTIREASKDWEYQQSDESVDVTIEANEYNFEEDGTRY